MSGPGEPGKNLVRGYAKHYGVDHLCAVAELRMLGVEVDPAYVARLEATATAKAKAKRREKARATAEPRQPWDDCDGTFAHIAGYTSGGAPYGVTWEEQESPPWLRDDHVTLENDPLAGIRSKLGVMGPAPGLFSMPLGRRVTGRPRCPLAREVSCRGRVRPGRVRWSLAVCLERDLDVLPGPERDRLTGSR